MNIVSSRKIVYAPLYIAAVISFSVSGAVVAEPRTATLGSWMNLSEVSALNGSKTYGAITHSTTTNATSSGSSKTSALVIRCGNGRLDVYVTWPVYMGSGTSKVSYRIDAQPVQNEDWGTTDDGLATGIFGGVTSPRPFLDQLKVAKHLVVQASPYQNTAIEAEFDLGQVSEVVAAAYEACA